MTLNLEEIKKKEKWLVGFGVEKKKGRWTKKDK